MIYLALSILVSSLLFLIFKWFEIKGVDNLQAIVVNYFVSCGLGITLSADWTPTTVASADWFPYALGLGVLFISLFNVLGRTAQKMGVSVASVANKMSVVMPVIAAIFLYGDQITVLKVLGILAALGGVWLTSMKKDDMRFDRRFLILPVILFLGSGVIDISLKYVQETFLTSDAELMTFIPTIFGIAAVCGAGYLLLTNNWRITPKNLLWGTILGVPNYFSIYLIIKTLEMPGMESSVVFPINNIGVVVVAVFASIALFRERLTQTNWVGVALAVAGIVLIGSQAV